VLDRNTGAIHTFVADATVLATGGSGKVYLYTSNPDVATGDGVALAYRAGATIANMEFVQFHPTCLYHPRAKSFLISEAVRGEGAILLNRAGKRFMEGAHPMRELAPRDIVARAIDAEMKRTGEDCVLSRHPVQGPGVHPEAFPEHPRDVPLVRHRHDEGADPGSPAAHYQCGGVRTNLHGETDIQRLFALGECAGTGLQRRESPRLELLIEALVFSHSAVQRARPRM